MPALARDFEVIAVNERGMGLSDKPQGGYDAGTLADDLVALMGTLGHQRFAVVGHDTGYIIGYALAADHRDRVTCVALAESPGPRGCLSTRPCSSPGRSITGFGTSPSPGSTTSLTEQLVRGREDIFLGYEFAIQGGRKGLPDGVERYCFDLFSDPDALRGSFGLYRALDTTIAQNEQRKTRPLTIPVLGIGGAESWGESAGEGM